MSSKLLPENPRKPPNPPNLSEFAVPNLRLAAAFARPVRGGMMVGGDERVDGLRGDDGVCVGGGG